MQAQFIGSRIYRGSSYGRVHPLAIPRVPVVTDIARAMGWLPREVVHASPRARPAALAAFHDPGYVDAVIRAEETQEVDADTRARTGLGTLSNPVFPEMYRRPATACGGSLLAAERLAQGPGRWFNPGGGTHHGLRDRANGFCYFNDPVLAILTLRRHGLRVAYVDIDAHHCDGVAAAFAGVEEVLMVSTHEAGRWPFTGALDEDLGGNALNLPLPRGAHDGDMSLALDAVILPAVERHRADVVVLQCGIDAVAEDPLSRLAMSNRAHRRVVQALMGGTDRLMVTGGGGYNPWTCGRGWAVVWATLAGHEIPDRMTPEAMAVQRALDWSRRWRPEAVHLETLLDAPREGPVSDEVRAGARALAHRLHAWA